VPLAIAKFVNPKQLVTRPFSLSLLRLWLLVACCFVFPVIAQSPPPSHPNGHNVIIFVADGLRHDSVNAEDAPTLARIQKEGVHFSNSHSLFPTFTTANASAIATGHYLGDTGDYSNTLWLPEVHQESQKGPVNFLEDNAVLKALNAAHAANYLGSPTFLSLARANGYQTAVVGKVGPAAILVADMLGDAEHPMVLIDDSNPKKNQDGSVVADPKLPDELVDALKRHGLYTKAPGRDNGCDKGSPCNNGNSGAAVVAGTSGANWGQQQFMTDVVTKVLLPAFCKSGPFALVFWSRDPDATQHNQGDSLNRLDPGINGPTSRLAIKNADSNLEEILRALNESESTGDTKCGERTDVFVTSDHGFATIARREIDKSGRPIKELLAPEDFPKDNPTTKQGYLPYGFLALDLARSLGLSLFDPSTYDAASAGGSGPFKKLNISEDHPEYPQRGSGLLGDAVVKSDGSDAKAIVAANGGSDLIYIPNHDAEMVRKIVAELATRDYVASLFINDHKYASVPGALPMSLINLIGGTTMQVPDVVVAFKVFYRDGINERLLKAVQVSDTNLQEGQGMHGGIGRDSTFNFMVAIGPDFKKKFNDLAPVSNADIVPTLSGALGFQLPRGSGMALMGRDAREARVGGPQQQAFKSAMAKSAPVKGRTFELHYQEIMGCKKCRPYPDHAE
jgi:predicted AlkP superfamily pyrophosphatase or phosphodiesterase